MMTPPVNVDVLKLGGERGEASTYTCGFSPDDSFFALYVLIKHSLQYAACM